MANEAVDDCLADLTEAEREKAKGYVRPSVREQFVVSRSVLRRLLSKYLKVDGPQIEITTQDNGKPILADPSRGLHFNLAHSNGWVMFAMAKRPVGIDVEPIRDVPNAGDLVTRFFATDEQRQYKLLPPELKRDGFLRGWTCKEAVLKATGAGIRAIDACTVCLDPTKPPRVIQYTGRPVGESWGLGILRPAVGMTAAVAVEGFQSVNVNMASGAT